MSSQLQQTTTTHQSIEDQQPTISNFTGKRSYIPTDAWILDTGATHHVCHTLQCFESISSDSTSHVTLPNGQTAPILQVGTIRLSPHIVLHNVLFIPSFKYNLVSVSALTKNLTCTLMFTADSCVIQDLTQGIKIGMAKKHRNLYYLQLGDNVPSLPQCNKTVCSSQLLSHDDLWHYRLGHPSFV